MSSQASQGGPTSDSAPPPPLLSVPLPQEGESAPAQCGVLIVDELTTVHLALAGMLDAAKELEKLAKREGEAEGALAQLRRKTALASYKERTPEEIKAADAERLAKLEGELESIRHHAEDMRRLV